MAKKTRKAARHGSARPARQRTQPTQSTANSPSGPATGSSGANRRGFIKQFRAGAIALGVIGAGSWWVGSEVIASIEEGDLSKIGNGTPTIVQIHDPGCPTCRALQAQTRAALAQFDDGELQYLVANIRQSDGKQLAAKHKVPHVTLLLFDGDGKRKDVLRGPNQRDMLVRAFRRLLSGEQSG